MWKGQKSDMLCPLGAPTLYWQSMQVACLHNAPECLQVPA